MAWSNGQASIGGQRTPPPSVEKTTPPPGMQIYPRRNQPFLLERRFTKGLNSQQSNFQLKCLEYMRPVQKDLSKCWRIPHRPEKSLGRRILPLSTITPRRSEGFSPGEGGGGRELRAGGTPLSRGRPRRRWRGGKRSYPSFTNVFVDDILKSSQKIFFCENILGFVWASKNTV